MSCNLNHVPTSVDCKENPAGLSNYMMVVPLDTDHITSIAEDDEKNQYSIQAAGGVDAALQGFRVDFKNQTGQVTSEDNGEAAGWTHTGTGRIDKNEDGMATLSRKLSNMGGGYLCFFPTGKKVNGKTEWKVVGNPTGDIQFSTAADTGVNRNDDHGTTFTVTCNYQVYDVVKYYGEIEQEDTESSSSAGA